MNFGLRPVHDLDMDCCVELSRKIVKHLRHRTSPRDSSILEWSVGCMTATLPDVEACQYQPDEKTRLDETSLAQHASQHEIQQL